MESVLIKPSEGEELRDFSTQLPTYGWREDLQEMVNVLDSRLKTHHDFIAASMIAYVSILIGNKAILEAAGYTNTAGLAMILVGRSSSGKSDAIKRLRESIDRIENQLHSDFDRRYNEWKKGGQQGEKPHEKKFIVDDYTYEKLVEDLYLNPNGLGIVRDEIKGWIDDWGAYHKSGEASKYLTLLDGGRVRLSRKNNDKDIVIPHAQISILGGIQKDYLRKTFTEDMVVSGFVPRLLFCFPDFKLKKRCREHLPKNILEPWEELCDKLASMDKRTLNLDSESESLYYQYIDILDRRAALSEDDNIASMCGKLQINVLRLTIATHFMGHNAELRTINKDELQYNIELMGYFERNWLKVYEYIKDRTPHLSNEQLIVCIHKNNPNAQQTSIADALGVSKQYVNKIISKTS